MGELTDTNAAWIAGRLPALGIKLNWATIIGDDLGQLTEGLRNGMERSDVIFTTGGLGPTQDDLTREAVAAAFGETQTVQGEVVDQLRAYFAARGQSMPSHNVQQAHLIPSAQIHPQPQRHRARLVGREGWDHHRHYAGSAGGNAGHLPRAGRAAPAGAGHRPGHHHPQREDDGHGRARWTK